MFFVLAINYLCLELIRCNDKTSAVKTAIIDNYCWCGFVLLFFCLSRSNYTIIFLSSSQCQCQMKTAQFSSILYANWWCQRHLSVLQEYCEKHSFQYVQNCGSGMRQKHNTCNAVSIWPPCSAICRVNLSVRIFDGTLASNLSARLLVAITIWNQNFTNISNEVVKLIQY